MGYLNVFLLDLPIVLYVFRVPPCVSVGILPPAFLMPRTALVAFMGQPGLHFPQAFAHTMHTFRTHGLPNQDKRIHLAADVKRSGGDAAPH